MTAKKGSLPKGDARQSTPANGTSRAVAPKAGSAQGEAQGQAADAGRPPMEAATKSAHGQRIGRPKTRLEDLKAVPTRCPAQIYTYLKGITPFLYPSLTAMFEDMMKRFLDERPWEHGLHWRKPKTAMTFAGGTSGKTGWEQVNIQLPQELAQSVAVTAESCGVSSAALCYTAIFWWVQYIYPPAKMTARQAT